MQETLNPYASPRVRLKPLSTCSIPSTSLLISLSRTGAVGSTWASKFWHFLNPEAFAIADRRVVTFFGLGGHPNSPDKYVSLLGLFRDFAAENRTWVKPLCVADENHAWCENKLWDKVFFGVVDIVVIPLAE